MNLSEQLARFVAETRFGDIPPSVIENQKKSVMDAVAVTYGAGTLGDGCRQMVAIAEALAANGDDEATVIGFDRKLPAHWAAFANAAMAHSLDFGDTHQKSTIHPNAAGFPAALAVGEQMGVSGKDLLTALVLGSETAIRIAMAADVNTTAYGFYPPSIYSSYGAVAAVAKLMGLSARQIVSAFSFNLCQTMCSSELVNNAATAVRSVREAFSARNAIVACAMARADLAGFDDPLEGELGFYHTFLRDQYTADRALTGLGRDYMAADLTYKAWPCCFGTHGALTAARQMLSEGLFTPDTITHIQVFIGAHNRILFEPPEQRRNPETAIVGKFSIPFTLASLLLRGDVDLDSFSPRRLHDRRIRALAAKIDYTYVESWQRGKEAYTKLVVETDHGRFERMVTAPFGTPENPMDDEAFARKFTACAAHAPCGRTREELDALRHAIAALETFEDIRDFTRLL